MKKTYVTPDARFTVCEIFLQLTCSATNTETIGDSFIDESVFI